MLTRKSNPVARGPWMSHAPDALERSSVLDTGRLPAVARFSGTLADLAVADLIQIVQLLGKSAEISVTQDGAESRVWCSAGELVDAKSGSERGEAALFHILSLDRGWLTAELRPVARTRTIFGSSQQLLLEAARLKDEALRRGEPTPAAALELVPEPPELPAAVSEIAELAQQAASLPPIVAQPRSRPPAGASRGLGTWLALAALVLVPSAYLLGAQGARQPATPAAAEVVLPARVAQAARYDITVQAEPESAELWLDGERVATGHLATSAARDGATHELRVSAAGHVPARIFFADAAPPARVRLEPLPMAPAAAAHAAVAPESIPAAPAAPEPAAEPVPATPAAGRGARDKAAASRTRSARTNEPRVRVIGEDEPRVRVLD